MATPTLIPELSVTDLQCSLAFYCDVLGFSLQYSRPDEGFAMLQFGGAALMLDQLGLGRDWLTASMHAPFGRGINLQIEIQDISAVLDRLSARGIALFQPVEIRHYAAGGQTITQRQFCVQDPDGYLLRFIERN